MGNIRRPYGIPSVKEGLGPARASGPGPQRPVRGDRGSATGSAFGFGLARRSSPLSLVSFLGSRSERRGDYVRLHKAGVRRGRLPPDRPRDGGDGLADGPRAPAGCRRHGYRRPRDRDRCCWCNERIDYAARQYVICGDCNRRACNMSHMVRHRARDCIWRLVKVEGHNPDARDDEGRSVQ